MAFLQPLNLLYFDLKDGTSVSARGTVLTLESTGKVDTCGATEMPIGVAYMTTRDPLYDPDLTGHTSIYETGVEVAVVREGKVVVPYHTNAGVAISIGDIVGVKGTPTAGKVCKFVPTSYPASYNATTLATIMDEQKYVVGIALEAASASATGEIEVLLSFNTTEGAS
ncbi:MAG: hypothetical protein ACTSWU_02915 [Candidatus Thorarchaeota archaeon]